MIVRADTAGASLLNFGSARGTALPVSGAENLIV
jgi:hypothetical protein